MPVHSNNGLGDVGAESLAASSALADKVGGAAQLERLLRNQAIAYGVAVADLVNPDLRAALMRATALSLNYGFLPGQHLHLQVSQEPPEPGRFRLVQSGQMRKTYAVVVGVRAYLDSFDQWKRENRKLAWVQTAELPQMETAAVTKSRYPHILGDPDDCGATARFLDQEEAEFCRKLNLPYEPQMHYGFWRKKAFERLDGNRKVWEPDAIPNQRAPMDVALLRATKACLMSRVPLLPINQFTFDQRLAQLEDEVAPELPPSALATALPSPRAELDVDSHGDVLFVRPRPRKSVAEAMGASYEFGDF